MISVDEATSIILDRAKALSVETVPLLEAVGCALAEEVISDVDLPPFDKSAMDGFAVRADDAAAKPVELPITQEITAGDVPSEPIGSGECARIMTGATVPDGADTVVMVEDTEPAGESAVRILRGAPRGDNICARGEDVRAGEVVLRRGHVLRAPEISLLASIGCTRPRVHRRPTVAMLATGDELVEIDTAPGPGQIRDANRCAIAASVAAAGCLVTDLGIARDEAAEVRERIEHGLASDVLIVSAGVSVGEYDLVPAALAEAGVEIYFHHIAAKPGRPLLFGSRGGHFVFGLPGNPVSTLVGLLLFVVPALRRMAGHSEVVPRAVSVVLDSGLKHKPGRREYVPCRLRYDEGIWRAQPIESHGSADVAAMTRANGLLVMPEEASELAAGASAEAIQIEG